MIKKILMWPAKPNNNLAPRWSVLWRLLWLGPCYLGLAVTTAAIFAGEGPDEAKRFWNWNA